MQVDFPWSTSGKISDLGTILATSEFGVIVAGVAEDSLAAQAGICVGDCIVQASFCFESIVSFSMLELKFRFI